ncbi:MAG: hypothetical protein H0W50_01375 [Parachlamydiaceae bacterium]|nr:hypothetical protein [Parachlamydiaceae bacterium]
MINNASQASPYTLPSLTMKLLEVSAAYHEQTQLPSASFPKKFFGYLISKTISITLVPITLIIDGLANLIFKPIIFLIESGICYIKGLINPIAALTHFRKYNLEENSPKNDRFSEVIRVQEFIIRGLEKKLQDSIQIESKEINNINHKKIRRIALQPKKRKALYEKQEKIIDDLLRNADLLIEESTWGNELQKFEIKSESEKALMNHMRNTIYDLQDKVICQQQSITHLNNNISDLIIDYDSIKKIYGRQKKKNRRLRSEIEKLQKAVPPEKLYSPSYYIQKNASPYKSPVKSSSYSTMPVNRQTPSSGTSLSEEKAPRVNRVLFT